MLEKRPSRKDLASMAFLLAALAALCAGPGTAMSLEFSPKLHPDDYRTSTF